MANINKQPYDENGREHGEWIRYHENGQLCYRWNYIHGTYHGLQEEYNSDGTLWYCGYHNMGRKVGCWYVYKQKEYYLWLI